MILGIAPLGMGNIAQQYGIPEVYNDLGASLQGPRAAALIIASPDALHTAA
jgi:predicted dehydrogenase